MTIIKAFQQEILNVPKLRNPPKLNVRKTLDSNEYERNSYSFEYTNKAMCDQRIV